HPDVRPGMPVAWDRGAGTIELLDGTGNIQTMAEDVFFSRGESLEHTALCLLRPGQLPRRQPTREQQLLLADFWFDRGFYRRAAAAYEALHDQALRDRVNIDSLVGSGNVLVRQGRPQQAIPLFDSALTLDPGNPRILNNLAYAMHQGHGNLAAALSHAEKATERAPGNPIYLETLGSLYLDLGDAPAAAHCFEQAWARTAGHAPEVQLPILDQLVRAWLAANRRDLAWQVAEHRRRSFPGHPFPKDIQLAFPALRNPLPNRR
ncbi:MAG TPA: tetratricopeptide repeat protein, partial [Kiritimatiellia bacterium]|nr:tetratricopeptide repeat protein [Kiritimatiellia bacterium]